jgi:drug/metabolite transporter (DMT)-like permease
VTLTFLLLCLTSRVAYSFNDVWIGRLARQHGRAEVAALRGVSLGITMAPLLWFVHSAAWGALPRSVGELSLLVSITACSNLLQLQAARHLPFGLRASLSVSTVALGSIALGAAFLEEHFSAGQLVWGAIVVASALVAARGDHSSDELKPDVAKGASFAVSSSVLMCVAAFFLLRLSHATDPLLAAWAWEFGSGLVLVPALLLLRRRGRFEPGIGRRFGRIAVAALPTVVGSGASALALTRGPLGLWGALAGTQVLFTALLGASLHRERVGLARWLCFAAGAAGVFGLAFVRR